MSLPRSVSPPTSPPNEKRTSSEPLDVPRLALRKTEAAAALGLSDESFDRYVRPSLPAVELGSLRLYPVAGLAAWLEERARSPLAELAERRGER